MCTYAEVEIRLLLEGALFRFVHDLFLGLVCSVPEKSLIIVY